MNQNNNGHRRHNGRHHQQRRGGHGGNGGGGQHLQRRSGAPVNLRNQTFDSHGPNGERVRGNAFQVYEKYLSLAREAAQRTDQENYYQHAEHYFRIVEAIQDMEAEQRARYAPPEMDDQPEIGGGNDEGSSTPMFGMAGDGADSGLTDLRPASEPANA